MHLETTLRLSRRDSPRIGANQRRQTPGCGAGHWGRRSTTAASNGMPSSRALFAETMELGYFYNAAPARQTSTLVAVSALSSTRSASSGNCRPSAAFDRRPSALLRRKLRVRGAVRDFASEPAIELGGFRLIQQGDVEIRHADRDPCSTSDSRAGSERDQSLPPRTQVVPSGYGWNASAPAADSLRAALRPSPTPGPHGSDAYILPCRSGCATSVPTKRRGPGYAEARDPTS
jgi:hypothetical protein